MVEESYEPLVFDSTERTYQQLSCANCGEPLQMTENEEVLTCELCGQGHKSIAPPPATKANEIEPGDSVAVLWGEHWWSAHVVEVLGRNKWRVHYEGWAPSFDEVVTASRIRALDYVPGSSIIPPVFEHTLKVKRANIISAVGIVLVLIAGIAFLLSWALGDQVFSVHSSSISDFEAANLGAITGRLPGMPVNDTLFIQPGQEFYVKWGEGWYLGTAVEVYDQNNILIQYSGWGADQDEIVTRDRLRTIP